MQKTRLVLTFFMCIAVIMLLVGCNILDNLIQDTGGKAPLGQILNRNTPNGDAVPVITVPQQQGEQTVKLFFADKSGKVLIEESRTIPKTLSLARETVNQWLIGPVSGSSDSYPAVNPVTNLKDINIKNGIATVDLSKEFLEPYGNVTGEAALYGLVNTVAQFSTVQMVKIRVEGQEINSYRGIKTDNLRYRNDMVGFSSGPITQSELPQTQPEMIVEQDPAQVGGDKPSSPSAFNLFAN